jgi:hypothetical protein
MEMFLITITCKGAFDRLSPLGSLLVKEVLLFSMVNMLFISLLFFKSFNLVKLFANIVKSRSKTLGCIETKDDNQNARCKCGKGKQ